MPYTLVLHVMGTDPIVGEVDEIPTAKDTLIQIRNPRRLDGKDLHYIAENVITVFFPIERMNFIELISSAEDEKIIGFVRE
jgi:hypothetical protein